MNEYMYFFRWGLVNTRGKSEYSNQEPNQWGRQDDFKPSSFFTLKKHNGGTPSEHQRGKHIRNENLPVADSSIKTLKGRRPLSSTRSFNIQFNNVTFWFFPSWISWLFFLSLSIWTIRQYFFSVRDWQLIGMRGWRRKEQRTMKNYFCLC